MLIDLLYNGVFVPLLRLTLWAGAWLHPKLKVRRAFEKTQYERLLELAHDHTISKSHAGGIKRDGSSNRVEQIGAAKTTIAAKDHTEHTDSTITVSAAGDHTEGTDSTITASSAGNHTERIESSPHKRDVPRIWFHASSMGELEQLISVIGELRSIVPDVLVFVSIWSPSALHRANTLNTADAVFFLPPDTRSRIRWLVSIIKPCVVIVNRYDLWRNMAKEIRAAGAHLLLVNATVPSAHTHALLRRWLADTYRYCTEIFAVTPQHAEMLRTLLSNSKQPLPPVQVLADTRTDRVLERVTLHEHTYATLRSTNACTVVVGSSWEPDEELIHAALSRITIPLRLIIVPHEPKPPTIHRIKWLFNAVPLKDAHEHPHRHVVVDVVGQLLSIYAASDAAFVGGGFGKGVHSVTEPAAFGVPIACGPHIHRSSDALELASLGALTVVTTAADVAGWLSTVVADEAERRRRGRIASELLQARAGTSRVIAQHAAAMCTDASRR